MRYLLFIAVLYTASAALAQSGSNSAAGKHAADDTPYPTADPRQFTEKLPFLKTMLDSTPQELTAGRIFSLETLRAPVAAWRDDLQNQTINLTHFQWVTPYLGASEVAIFSLTNGRVQRIAFFYHDLRAATAANFFHQFAKLDPDGHVSDTGFEIQLQNVGIVAYLEGTHTFPVEDPEKHPSASARQFGGDSEASYHDEHFSSMIVVGIDAQDWYLLHNKVPDERAKAIKAGIMVAGMTPQEAALSMRGYGVPSVQFDSTYANGRMDWHGGHHDPKEYDLIHDPWLDAMAPHISSGKTAASAQFQNGVLTSHHESN